MPHRATTPGIAEDTVVEAAKGGDEAAFAELVGRYRRELHAHYRMATNTCLDVLRSSRRRVPSLHSVAEVPWLQPYPDRLLDELAPSDTQPDAVVVPGRPSGSPTWR
jgi:hypothetical protein